MHSASLPNLDLSRLYRTAINVPAIRIPLAVALTAVGVLAVHHGLDDYSQSRGFALIWLGVCSLLLAMGVLEDQRESAVGPVLRAICAVADRSEGIFTVERVVAEIPTATVAHVERVIADLEARSRVTWEWTADGACVLWRLPGYANARVAGTDTKLGSHPGSMTAAANRLP